MDDETIDKLILFDNVSFCYSDNKFQKNVFEKISFHVERGEFIGILGRNGCGKSTLSKLANGIFLPSSGNVYIDGINTKNSNFSYEIRKKIGLVFQNPDNQIVCNVVEEEVAFGLKNLGYPKSYIRDRVDEVLNQMGIFDLKHRYINSLSGGQKQRVAICGVLAMQPECIIFDEPTSMLDSKSIKYFFDIVNFLNKNKKIAVILITHNLKECFLSDKILILNSEKIVYNGNIIDVLYNIDFLKSNGISIPQSIELINRLKNKGYDVSLDAIVYEDCLKNVINLLEAEK